MGQEYAYITGAASGLGFLIAKFLVSKGIKVFIADIDGHSVEAAGKELNVPFGTVNVACWESQVKTFEEAVAQFGRIDYVYPIAGIGERTWIPSAAGGDGRGFARPDMSIIDVNVNGLMFTVALALQQFRRQSLGEHGLKGKSKSLSAFTLAVSSLMSPFSSPVCQLSLRDILLLNPPNLHRIKTCGHRPRSFIWQTAS